jgi:hypothetical protein
MDILIIKLRSLRNKFKLDMFTKIYSFYFLVFILLIGCSSPSKNIIQNSCSSISETDKGLLLHSTFYKLLDNGTVLSVTRVEIAGDTSTVPKTTISPIYPKGDSASWQIQFEANEYKIVKDLLISELVNFGNDASYKLFNLNNGKEVIKYTYDKFDVLFSDENEKRFLGFYGMNAADKASSGLDFNDLTFGFLSFSNKDEILGQIRIDTKDDLWLDVLDISNPVIELMPLLENALSLNSGKTLYFTGADGTQSSDVNFDIQITFYTTDTYKPVSFTLHVRKDKFELVKDFSNTIFHLESL